MKDQQSLEKSSEAMAKAQPVLYQEHGQLAATVSTAPVVYHPSTMMQEGGHSVASSSNHMSGALQEAQKVQQT